MGSPRWSNSLGLDRHYKTLGILVVEQEFIAFEHDSLHFAVIRCIGTPLVAFERHSLHLHRIHCILQDSLRAGVGGVRSAMNRCASARTTFSPSLNSQFLQSRGEIACILI